MPYGLEIPDRGSIKVMGGNGELNRSTLDELPEIGFLFSGKRVV
jgi:hypothetical protein